MLFLILAWGIFNQQKKILDSAIIHENCPDSSKEYFLLAKIILLSHQNEYRKCLDSIINNFYIFNKHGWSYKAELLYLKKKLGILDSEDYEIASNRYLFRQVISYSEKEALSHIEKHLSLSDSDTVVKFIDNFPIYDIYNKLRSNILLGDKSKTYDSIINSKHIFRYQACGHVNSKLVDFFEVVTLKDTDEIITMYPYENKEKRECIDLTPVVNELPKVKKLSQIDKFNQRYSKK